MTLAFILIVLYVNFVRYTELTSCTTIFRVKEYFKNDVTIIYNITLIMIWIGVFLLKILKI